MGPEWRVRFPGIVEGACIGSVWRALNGEYRVLGDILGLM